MDFFPQFSIFSILYIVSYTLYTWHSTLQTVHSILCSVDSILCSIHNAQDITGVLDDVPEGRISLSWGSVDTLAKATALNTEHCTTLTLYCTTKILHYLFYTS